MHPIFRSALPALTFSITLASSAGAFGFLNKEPLDEKQTDAATTALTSKILENSQFAHKKLDAALAEKFLERYFDTLDGGRNIFFQSDIEEFTKAGANLAEDTRSQGDSKLAHSIFKRYLERLDQRTAFSTQLLTDGKFDFSTDETYQFDRKKAQRPADLSAAQELWKEQVRYEYLQEKLAGKNEGEIPKTLVRRTTRIVESMRKLSEKAVLEMYLEALAQVYDPHSDYMGPEQLKSFQISMNLSLIGIGATLTSDDGFCKIMELVPGGPAFRSGLIKSGDRIVGVSQKQGDEFTDLVDLPLSQAVDLIRGKKGTTVHLNIIPAEAADDSVRKTISIVREEIKLEDQQAKAKIIDLPSGDKTQRIGIIDLPTFYAGEGDAKNGPTSASADVNLLLSKLKKENITGLILDLRRNGGGSLQEAIDLTGLFIPSGPVVQTRTMDGDLEVGKDRDGKVAYDGPLVVLTSRFSASASEIVAGALQDYGRAVIVGDTSTFGKGTVQTIIPLARIMQGEGIVPNSDPGALKVTISKFYRPSGKSTQLEGVKADIVVPSLSDLPEIGESDLSNPLPWDTIAAQKLVALNRVNPALAELRKRSNERISKSPDFADLKGEIDRFKKMREDKAISLNEATRQKEKADLKIRNEALEKERLARATPPPAAYEVTVKNALTAGLSEAVKPKKPTIENKETAEALAISMNADEVILNEAKNILLDYVGLVAQPVVSQR
jgi:carboxyl-terminal processing protease